MLHSGLTAHPAAAVRLGVHAGREGAPAPQSEHVGGRRAENPIRTAGDRLSRRAWCPHAVWHCPACSPVCSSVSPGLLGWTPRTGERSQLAFLSGKSRQSRSRGAFISCWRKLSGLPLRSRSSHRWPRAGLREGKDSLCQRNARGGRPGCSDLPSGQATGRPVLRALCGEACRPWLPGLTRKVAAGGGQCPPPGLPSPGCLSPLVEARAAACVRAPAPGPGFCGYFAAWPGPRNITRLTSAQPWSVRAERLCCQRRGPAGSQGPGHPRLAPGKRGPGHPGTLQPGCSLRLFFFCVFLTKGHQVIHLRGAEYDTVTDTQCHTVLLPSPGNAPARASGTLKTRGELDAPLERSTCSLLGDKRP